MFQFDLPDPPSISSFFPFVGKPLIPSSFSNTTSCPRLYAHCSLFLYAIIIHHHFLSLPISSSSSYLSIQLPTHGDSLHLHPSTFFKYILFFTYRIFSFPISPAPTNLVSCQQPYTFLVHAAAPASVHLRTLLGVLLHLYHIFYLLFPPLQRKSFTCRLVQSSALTN